MNKKRQQLIDTALTLFYAKGINNTGINEVLSVSGIAKNTLYNHFNSKEELIIAALEQRHSLFVDWLKEKLEGAKTNKEVVIRLFSGLEEWFTGTDPELGDFRGCFFINSSAEFSEKQNAIPLFCLYHKQNIRDLIEHYMPEKDDLLLDAICLMKEGATTAAYVSNDTLATKKCIYILNKFLDGQN